MSKIKIIHITGKPASGKTSTLLAIAKSYSERVLFITHEMPSFKANKLPENLHILLLDEYDYDKDRLLKDIKYLKTSIVMIDEIYKMFKIGPLELIDFYTKLEKIKKLKQVYITHTPSSLRIDKIKAKTKKKVKK